MLQKLEIYLIELMRKFEKTGIVDADGNHFQPESFEPNETFNYGDLKEFPLDLEQVKESLNDVTNKPSHAHFFDPNYTEFQTNPQLLNSVKEQGWIDATTNDHEYPVTAIKALWNHALHSLIMMMSNPVSVGYYKDYHQNFMHYTAAYMDDTRVTLPEAVEKKVKFYCVPLVVDHRTLAFAETCLEFINYVASLEDPLEDLKKMYPLAPNWILALIDERKAKTKIGFKVTQAALIDRIGRYKARVGKLPTEEESVALLAKMTELKKPAQDATNKYQAYFKFTADILEQNREFEQLNSEASNEIKAQFYNAQLEKFREFAAKSAPTAAEIEINIQELKSQLRDLSAKTKQTLGTDQPVYYFTKNYVDAIYNQKRPEAEIIINVETDVINAFQHSIDQLEQYKNSIERTQQSSKETKHQIETKLQEVTLLGKAKKLVADKKEADKQLAKLRENKTRLESTLQQLNETGIEFFKNELTQKIGDFNKAQETVISMAGNLQKTINILETAENWDKKIDDSLLDELSRLLKWRTETLQLWKQKNNDYQWSKTDEAPPISQSTDEDPVNNESANSSFFSWSGLLNTSTTLASSLASTVSNAAFEVSATFADMTPKQELISELKQNLYALEDQQSKNTEQFNELNGTLEKLNSGDEGSTEKAMRDIETRKQSIERKRLDLDSELGNLVTNGNELSDQYKQLLSERTENLNAIITSSTEQLRSLEIHSGKIEDLKAIFDTTANDIRKIKEEFNAIVAEGRGVFESPEITTAKEDFNRQYELYEKNQLILIKSMTEMADQLLNDCSGADKTEKMEQHINVLATQLKELALTYLPQEKTLAEKIQAKENFEHACGQELYSNNIKIAAGVVVGILTTIVLCAAITAALAVFFAGGGWLAFMIGAPILAKAGVTAAATSLTVGGCIVGGAVGEHLDEKHSQAYFEQWRFFYEKVDKVASKACENTKNSATTTQRPRIDVELDLSSILLDSM